MTILDQLNRWVVSNLHEEVRSLAFEVQPIEGDTGGVEDELESFGFADQFMHIPYVVTLLFHDVLSSRAFFVDVDAGEDDGTR